MFPTDPKHTNACVIMHIITNLLKPKYKTLHTPIHPGSGICHMKQSVTQNN
jgi:hypothetical protein